ncbi:sigma 54-interacting transcriptional regulator [Zophobihabitans entericus]|uniref:Sigma 54-interacting transcriptional regulator n=1 Tax=Zophobihabitans entericus TaxID=1635327 RepID=A0A6G9I9K2_9GAMM|nr:sigma-54-dependent transcriptional regulator [Zophobihabitans entericus]QIQ20502.1 sigma 54-interacting transcriptional regulator [Zophobihabitans entericus]
MLRIDIIYNKLQEIAPTYPDGITTQQLADLLNYSRANVSNDLNLLVQQEKVIKNKGKPVKYFPTLGTQSDSTSPAKQHYDQFDKFVETNTSLHTLIEQAKAAIFYPPNGMNMLILGETGVGKSMFAELIYDYAKKIHKINDDAPFIHFNCADYASNPQLLLAQLFGSKKGAYSGAIEDRMGLIEKAHNGFLFLDEVHRLSPEGQEIFFTFIDKGIFHRLGETEERTATVRIISATTEDPNSALLRTFTRRFPMLITLPPLRERSFEERFSLIQHFFNIESAQLKEKIVVSSNALRALLGYDCPNNIGQLKSDIRFICAAAYAKYISGNQPEHIYINSSLLPPHISSALLIETKHRQTWNKIIGINRKNIIFQGEDNNILYENNQTSDIYDIVNRRITELKTQGVETSQLEEEIEQDIQDYFQTYVYNNPKRYDINKLKNIISTKILRLTETLIDYTEQALQRELNGSIYYSLATHIESTLKRINNHQTISHPQLNKIRTNYPREFNAALDCLRTIEHIMDITIPIDEAAYLAMFFIYGNDHTIAPHNNVQVIVIAHGTQTATAMTHTAHELLSMEYAMAFDVPLNAQPQVILDKIVEYLHSTGGRSDVLLLVDMGSLKTFGEEIEQRCHVNTRTIQLVSTLHIIEAIQNAANGHSLQDVYQNVIMVNSITQEVPVVIEKEESIVNKKLAILIINIPNNKSTHITKELLMKTLSYRKNILDIISFDLPNKDNDIYQEIVRIQQDYVIVAIISPFNFNTAIAQFDLTSLLYEDNINRLQQLIDIETIYSLIEKTLSNILSNIDQRNLLSDIKLFNENISKQFNIHLSNNTLIGLVMHIACMLEQLVNGKPSTIKFLDKENYINRYQSEFNIIKQELKRFERKLNTTIPDDEICYILKFFNHA